MLDILRQRTRRIMLELVLDDSGTLDQRSMWINGASGVGMAYLEAFKLGLVRLKPGADPEGFRFRDIYELVDGVAALIDEEEDRAYADLEDMTAHRRIRLRAELRRLEDAGAGALTGAPASTKWLAPTVAI